MLHRPIEVAGVKRTSNEWVVGTKNPAHGRVFSFRGSGGSLCTLARSPEPLAVLDVPLIAA